MSKTIIDPSLSLQRPAPTRPLIPFQAVEWLIYCLGRDQQLLLEARQVLASHHFQPHESVLQLLYEAICSCVDSYGGITYESVCYVVQMRISQSPLYAFSDEQLEAIFRNDSFGLVWQLTKAEFDYGTTNQAMARELLSQLVYERTVYGPLRRLMAGNPGVPENLSGVLESLSDQTARISSLQGFPEVNIAPEVGAVLRAPSVFHKTSVGWLDARLNGQREGDCNGLLGPTGGGKTTLAVHMAVACAKQCWQEAQVTGGPAPIVVYVTAEEAASKLLPRIWSAFCDIRRAKLEEFESWDQLTQPGDLDAYELKMQAGQEDKLSEIERYQLNAPIMRECLRVLDISGSDEFPGAGYGYIPEISAYLSRYDRPIRSVFIDYAGLVCMRHMEKNGWTDKDAYRRLLQNFGDQGRKEISERYSCTTWVAHQLRGEAGSFSPTKLMTHSDAGESKDFAVNMAVCMCLGTEDKKTGCRLLNVSKVRYRPGAQVQPVTLKIHDDFAVMQDVTSDYMLDPAANKILTREEAKHVMGLEQVGGPVGMLSADETAVRL